MLELDPGRLDGVRARGPERLPVVLSHAEVRRILDACPQGSLVRLFCELFYGTGMRLLEVCRLRIKDIDFQRRQILVRDGKGEKDRVVPFPERCLEPMRQQIEITRTLHQSDLAAGYGSAWLPYAIAEKYPAAAREFLWQFVFPAGRISSDPRSGAQRRHHVHENSDSVSPGRQALECWAILSFQRVGTAGGTSTTVCACNSFLGLQLRQIQAGLENRSTLTGTQGSNPCLSAFTNAEKHSVFAETPGFPGVSLRL